MEDQFDFHSYCLRKLVLCAYVDMLNLEDRMRGHKFFRQAAELAIEVGLILLNFNREIFVALDLYSSL